MHFFILLMLFAIGGVVHGAAARAGTTRRLELVLVWLLAGYHGFVMLAVSGFALLAPDRAAELLHTSPGNPFQMFCSFAFLGMSLAAILTIGLRGVYLVGPITCWSTFFFGAGWVHLADYHARGQEIHTHLLLDVILAHTVAPAMLVAMGAWLWARCRRSAAGAP